MSPNLPKANDLPAISVKDLTVAFGGFTAIENVSFDIPQGAVAAIIGPNGSGKTTAVKAILGLVPKEQGEVKVLGKHVHSARQFIGYVPQRFDFDREFPMTVGEFMDLARRIHCGKHFPKEAIVKKIKEVGLAPEILDQRLGTLSGGQLQRVLIAQAIINDPLILFLDEPAAGIDIAGEQTLYEILQHLNEVHQTTVVMVTHEISMISQLVDTVICVNHKMVCYGPPTETLTEQKIHELFGEDTKMYHHHRHEPSPPAANDSAV
jgi:zinc transport system ATP-binding protein